MVFFGGAAGRRRALQAAARLAGAWAGAVLLGLGGCADPGADPTKAQVRLVNASGGYAALDLLVDDKRLIAAAGYGQSEAYGGVDPDQADAKITRPESTTALLSTTLVVRKERYYALVAYGGVGGLRSTLLDENTAAPASGKALIRVLNAAPDAGTLDVYLTVPGEPLVAATPLQAGAAVGQATDFLSVDAGDSKVWQLRVTAAGDRSDLRLDIGGLTLPSKGVTTLVLTATTGGVLVNALLLEQEDRIRRFDGTQARLRAAAPNAGVVTATVGGVPLLGSVTAPAVGSYELVTAGQQPVLVQVDGAVLALPPVNLAPGTDQTLLVYRANGVVGGQWLVDDNRLPLASGQAKIRLVHGLDFPGNPLALKVNFLPIGGDVALPGASAYGSVVSGLENRVTVSETGDPVALFDLSEVALISGGVYSVFVVEGSAPDNGFIRRDR
jgi:hypothetical protein